MRGYLVIDAKLKKKYFDNCFNAYWKDNIDISNEENLSRILETCEIDIKFFNENINQQKIKDELKELTSNAFEMDIFGAPTFIVNKKLCGDYQNGSRIIFIIDLVFWYHLMYFSSKDVTKTIHKLQKTGFEWFLFQISTIYS